MSHATSPSGEHRVTLHITSSQFIVTQRVVTVSVELEELTFSLRLFRIISTDIDHPINLGTENEVISKYISFG